MAQTYYLIYTMIIQYDQINNPFALLTFLLAQELTQTANPVHYFNR